MGAAGHREAAVGEQQEAVRRLRDSRRVVQFHRNRSEVTAAPSFPRRRESSVLTQRHWVPAFAGTAKTRCCSTSSSACWGSCRRSSIVGALGLPVRPLLPGDPARLAAGPDATPETVELVRKDLGLDRPLPQQFAALRRRRRALGLRPVAAHQASRARPKSPTASCRRSGSPSGAWCWSVLFGMTIGILSAVWRNRWPDRLGMTLAVSGISFPAFALGMVLMQVFSVQLGWLPTVGDDTLAPLHPAVDHARRRGRRDHGALHALVVRRHPRRGLHPDRAREGPATSRRVDRQARDAQRADPGRDDDGPPIRLSAGRLDRRREGLQLARASAAC